jgi:hypothetical protein
MGILSSLFGSKSKLSNKDIFSKYANNFLLTAQLPANDANVLKATVYLCFAQLACINSVSQGSSKIFMDNMVEDAKNSVLHLKMKVKDLVKGNDELEIILSYFPLEAEVDGDTTINGLAAWNAIYFNYVEEIVVEISNNNKGPFGCHGYAAIKLLEGLRGKGKSENQFMEVIMLLTAMTGDVIKAFR